MGTVSLVKPAQARPYWISENEQQRNTAARGRPHPGWRMRRHFVLARGRSCGCASSTPADTEGAGRAARAAAAARPGGHPRGAVCRSVA
ncbi:hypothetical protein G6F32_013481 [Rhizopus arrhizus]|nr:hypothetical protein G6F32_013481 [Rhizopus arrhizus]